MQKEIERLRNLGHGKKAISRVLGISRNTVRRYWPDEKVEQGTPPIGAATRYHAPWSAAFDWLSVEEATSRGQALADYWSERQSSDVELSAIPYVSFWREYRRRYPRIALSLHQSFPPGLRMEVDFKGREPLLGYWDRSTEQFVGLELFGAVLAFSQLFYAEATESQKQPEWFRGVEGAFRYFGGVTETVVSDNAKPLVGRASRYDPDINPEYWKFSEAMGFAPMPARPSSPRDKSTIEGALNLFWRWLRPRISQKRFYSKSAVNDFLRESLGSFNERQQKKYGASRRQRFDLGEREKLRPLPERPFETGDWRKAKLHPDCHFQAKKNFYSAPHRLRGEELDVRVSQSFVEVFHRLERVAIHRKLPENQQGRFCTDTAHLPEKHLAHLEFTPKRAAEEAARVGPETEKLVLRLLHQSRHPLLFLRRVQGILRLRARYGSERLEFAALTLERFGIQFPRLAEVEGIARTEPRAPKVKTVFRNPNPNLRGQMSWSCFEETPQ